MKNLNIRILNSGFRFVLTVFFLLSSSSYLLGADLLSENQSVCKNEFAQPLVFLSEAELVVWEFSYNNSSFSVIPAAFSKTLDPEFLGPITQNIFVRVLYRENDNLLYSNVVSIQVVSIPSVGDLPSEPIVVDYGDSFETNLYANIVDGSLIDFSVQKKPSWINFTLPDNHTSQLFGDFSSFPNLKLSGIVSDSEGGYYVISSVGTSLYYISETGKVEMIRSNLISGKAYSLVIHDGYLYIPRQGNNDYSISRIPLNNIQSEEEKVVSIEGGVLYLKVYDGKIYASSITGNSIIKIDPQTKAYEIFVNSSNNIAFSSPFGFDFDLIGNLFIATGRNAAIFKYDGVDLVKVYQGNTTTEDITSIQYDPQGYFYVSFNRLGVRKYNQDFSFWTTVSLNLTRFTIVYNIEFSPQGSLVYVLNESSNIYRLKTGLSFSGTSSKADLGLHEIQVQVENGNCASTSSFYVNVVDRIPPVLVSTSPIHQATNVPLWPTLSFNFDEEIKLGNFGVIQLRSQEGLLLHQFDLSNADDREQVSLSEDELSLSINLPQALPHLTDIVVSFESGAVMDISDNIFEGFSFDSKSYTFTTKDKTTQSFNFPPIEEKTYGDQEFVLGDEFTDQGKSITYSAADPSLVSITGNVAKILRAGQTSIQASSEGDFQFYPAPTVSRDLSVKKAGLTVTLIPQRKTFDGATFQNFPYQISGWAYEENESFLSGSLNFGGKATTAYVAGFYELSLNFDQLESANYTFIAVPVTYEILPKELRVDVDPNQGKRYGELDPPLGYQVSGWVSGDGELLLLGEPVREIGESVGIYRIEKGSLSAGPNYVIKFTANDFSIQPKSLKVVAKPDQGKIYGEEDPLLYYSVLGFIVGEGEELLDGQLHRENGELAITYWINKGTLTAGPNYEIDYIGSYFEIKKKRLVVSPLAYQQKKYGEEDPACQFELSGFIVGDGMELVDGSLSREDGESVDAYRYKLGSLQAGPNYFLQLEEKEFLILPSTLLIRATPNQNKTYGSTEPLLIYIVEGLQIGDLEEDVLEGGLLRTSGEEVGFYPISQGDLRSNSNYELIFISDQFEITRKVLEILVDPNQGKSYGELDPPLGYQVSGWVSGDGELLLSGEPVREIGESVGIYRIEKGSLSAGPNYVIKFTANDFSIQPKSLKVVAKPDQGKIYGEEDPLLYYSVSGFIVGEGEELLDGQLHRENGESVGTYEIGQGSIHAGKNYKIEYIGANFEIWKRNIRVIANEGQFKVYGQLDSVFTYKVEGLLPEQIDTVPTGNLERFPGEEVDSYDITIGSLDFSANYSIQFISATYQIRPRRIKVEANPGQWKIFGSADPEFSYTLSGLVGGASEVEVSGSLSRDAGEQVGKYSINLGSVSAGKNYTIEFTSSLFEIVPKELIVISLPDQSKQYGDEEPDLLYQATGFERGEDESILTGGITRQMGETVGKYLISKGDLSAGGNYLIKFISDFFTISKRSVKIVVKSNQSKIYGDPDPKFRVDFEGVNQVAHQALFLTLIQRKIGETVGRYEFFLSESDLSQNYSVEFIGGNFEILKRELLIIPHPDQFKMYKDPDPIFDFSIKNLAHSDLETLVTGELSRSPGESIRKYPYQTGKLSASDNYKLVLVEEFFEIKEIDRDGDAVPDHIEEEQGTDPLDLEDYLDSDGDGVPDYVEYLQMTDPLDPSDYLDSDGDGVPDYVEILDGSEPENASDFKDKNGNGTPDYIDLRAIVYVFKENIVLPWGSAKTDLLLPDSVAVITSQGDTIRIGVTWEEILLDFFKSGQSNVDGALILPPGLFNPYYLKGIVEITILPKPFPEDLLLSNNSFTADPTQASIFVGYFTVIDMYDDIHLIELASGFMDNSFFKIIGNELFWNSAETAPGRTIFTIKVKVIDRDGNVFEKEFQIFRIIPSLFDMRIFNTFSPNGDGINESWGIPTLVYYEKIQLYIFDRGGRVLFFTNQPTGRWDGRFEGNDLPLGSYFWVVQVEDTGEIRRGFLNIIKE